jgi:chaperonin GroEL (HSP60 family)
MFVASNVVFNPMLVPGGGAVEMAISVGLHACAQVVTGIEAGPFCAVADALEVIPRRLVQNGVSCVLSRLVLNYHGLIYPNKFCLSFTVII